MDDIINETTKQEERREISAESLAAGMIQELSHTGIPEFVVRDALAKVMNPGFQLVSLPDIRTRDKVIILGFAPSSRDLVPLDDDSFDMWPLNEIYMEMPRLESRATTWFQLHGYEPPTIRDACQVNRLAALRLPVIMWKQHPQIPNSIAYPLPQAVTHFDVYGEGMATHIVEARGRTYFTNSISWMIALAIMLEYKEIHVYGVDMAQDQEFSHQRPSVEFFLGWARGAGIKLYIPPQSDLCKTWIFYGLDDGHPYRQWLEARQQELMRRRQEIQIEARDVQGRLSQLSTMDNQMIGAQQDNEYMIRFSPLPAMRASSGKENKK